MAVGGALTDEKAGVGKLAGDGPVPFSGVDEPAAGW